MEVILASTSPRRAELLARLTYPFAVEPADIDESRLPGEEPENHVRRLAAAKATRLSRAHPGRWVLGADTVVVLGGEILGKPSDDADAVRMLTRLAGQSHLVLTGVAWARDGSVAAEATSRSEVRFRRLDGGEIAAYVAGGEPRDKAGAYAIQGGAASFVTAVRGSVTGVIGLPLEDVGDLAGRLGVPGPTFPLPPRAVELRYRAVAGEVAALTVAAGRPPRSARLVSVSKGHPSELLAAAIRAGATDVGESYVQEAAAKRAALPVEAETRWHLLAPLQTNKAGLAARTFDLFHAVDRVETARALARRAARPPAGLLQVNVARDPAKAGVTPEDAAQRVAELAAVEGFELRGLMTIGPPGQTEAEARRTFAALRALFDELRSVGYERLSELSMGMSDDYPAAIAEGATLVRLGTAIFGARARRGT